MNVDLILSSTKRPNWDLYFMGLAYWVSLRSLDPTTKHGCVAVKDKVVLGCGYNSYPMGCNDDLMPTERTGEVTKYEVTGHSEENLIALAARKGVALEGATLYITGKPCCACLRSIINAGFFKIIYGDRQSKCVDDKSEKASALMLNGQLTLEKFEQIAELKILVKNFSSQF